MITDRDPGDEAKDPAVAVGDLDVYTYRYETLLEFGFHPGVAADLAASRADLHEISDLIEKGCPLDILVDIVL